MRRIVRASAGMADIEVRGQGLGIRIAGS